MTAPDVSTPAAPGFDIVPEPDIGMAAGPDVDTIVAPDLGMDVEDIPARYGGYMLQRGDDDAQQIWGGRRRTATETQPAAGQTGFVRKLQEDLRELGFLVAGTPNGRFRWWLSRPRSSWWWA